MNRLMAKPSPELLRKVGLFRDLDEKDLASLADEFNERRFSPGQTIAREGSGGLRVLVVDSGGGAAASVISDHALTHESPAELHEIFFGTTRIARKCDGLGALDRRAHASPEDDATDARGSRASRNLAWRLARARRLVHGTLAGDDEVAVGDCLLEAEQVEHGGRTANKIRSEGGECGSQPACGTGSREVCVGLE